MARPRGRCKTIDKQQYKLTAKQCRICKNDAYEVLDVHRLIPGKDKGAYALNNVTVLCANCHRKVHRTKEIIIDRWYFSTAGYLLRIIENGEERFV